MEFIVVEPLITQITIKMTKKVGCDKKVKYFEYIFKDIFSICSVITYLVC